MNYYLAIATEAATIAVVFASVRIQFGRKRGNRYRSNRVHPQEELMTAQVIISK